jgi:radical SAM protein with 4Fe4S-binding SPASM domain
LSGAEAAHIIDQVADAGCLFFLITGGEPLLRTDFPQLYRYAREKGLVTTVFTNGTLIDEKIVALFREYPPRAVEISLYGATAQTYERVTGVAGSYGRCMAGIQQLLAAHVPVRLKTIMLSLNIAELGAMQELARTYGVRFRYDPLVFGTLAGDPGPLALRVPASDAVAAEFRDPARPLAWSRYLDEAGAAPSTRDLFICGAGRTTYHVDAFGNLQPCILVSRGRRNLREQAFAEAWQGLSEVVTRQARPGHLCQTCEARLLCGNCPGLATLEHGDDEGIPAYACAVGHERLSLLQAAAGAAGDPGS